MNCSIKFLRNVNGVFYSGNLLEGSVVIDLTDSVRIYEITCLITGFAKCKWTLSISKYHLQTFTSRLDYLNEKLTIVDSASNGVELLPGQNNFDFSFQLPSTLPTSFKSKYGSIKYNMQVDVQFDDTTKSEMVFELPFVVICPANLNLLDSILKGPIKKEISKGLNFRFSSSEVGIAVVIPQGGYVIGQTIEVLIEVENFGKTRIKYLKIMLKKIANFVCTQPKVQEKKLVQNEVKELIFHEIPPRSKRDFLRAIPVPPVPPNIENCEIISVTYELRVKAKTMGWNKSPVIKIPIIIGTTPILSSETENPEKFGILPPSYQETFRQSTSTDSSSEDE